jgi:hypothetical protein
MPTSKENKTEIAPGDITGDGRIDELLERLRACGISKAVSASEWQEVVDYLSENLMTEERIMKEYNCGRVTGMENARDLAASCILDTAAEIFKMGKDDEQAQQLRNLSKKVKDHVNAHTPKPPPKT